MIYIYFLDEDCEFGIPEELKEETIGLMKNSQYVEFPTEKEMMEYVSDYRANKIKNNLDNSFPL